MFDKSKIGDINYVKQYMDTVTVTDSEEFVEFCKTFLHSFNIDVLKLVIDKYNNSDLLDALSVRELNNQAIIHTTSFSSKEMVQFLLTYVDPSAQNNQAIINASKRGRKEIVKLLLTDKRVDPSAQNNIAIINAAAGNRTEMVQFLLADKRVDPSAQNNMAIIEAAKRGHKEVIPLLLEYPKVDPSAQNNVAIISASTRGHKEIVQLLLTDPRVDPSAQDNTAIINASTRGHKEIAELLLADLRVDPYEYYRIFSANKELREERRDERRRIDSYFGLITEDDYYRNKPVELLKYILVNSERDSLYTARNINYVFMCFDKDNFDKVINSDIPDMDLKFLLSCVKKIRFNITISNNTGERNPLIIFSDLIDYDYLVDIVLQYEQLLYKLTIIDVGTQNLLKIYRKYNFNLPLLREYTLVDIIFRRDTSRLYKYILNGNYLPYVEGISFRMWLKLTDDERIGTETFMFPDDYHDDYVTTLSDEHEKYWLKYIHGDNIENYELLNKKLRGGLGLTKSELKWFNSMSVDIINAPVTNKRCVLYRGINVGDTTRDTTRDTTTWKSFSSCSSVKEIADEFSGGKCCLFIIIVPENAVLLDITNLKGSELEIMLPPYSIMKYLGVTGGGDSTKCIILKCLGYETKYGPYYYESEEERNKTLEEEMNRYDIV